MCGIVGIIKLDSTSPDKDAIHNACEALSSRGPDNNGIYTDRHVGLGHTRLSIIDVENGAQPMTNDQGVTVVFNGEIYSDLELREKYCAGYKFETQSDTESLLALYQSEGVNFPRFLRGMYAVALYDPKFNRVILARDPYGIKPLFIHTRLDSLSFASEVKALKILNPTSIDTKCFRKWVNQNYFLDNDMPYRSIEKLYPGEVRVYENGVLVENYTTNTIDEVHNTQSSENDFEDILLDSVSKHTRSDVGYSVFLSGGVDSTSICVALHKLGIQSIETYTAAFDVKGSNDERLVAKDTAKALGFNYNEVMVTEACFWESLPEIAKYMDDPVADYAIIPTWLLAKQAQQDNQKVILCGEGGDEFLGGYGRYKTRFWKDWRKAFTTDVYKKRYKPEWTRLQKKQAKDIWSYLPNDLLVKLDSCLMAHGLEGRTPFIDQIFSPYAFNLPDKHKYNGKYGKYILRCWLAKQLPTYPAFAKKKGFTVPVGHWIENSRKRVESEISSNLFLREILTKKEIESIRHKSAKDLWPLLYLSYWANAKH
jgi:asparagine synthase (glutamine-hydrolysing)